MRALGRNARGTADGSERSAIADDRRGLRLVLRPRAHPVQQRHWRENISKAFFREVFLAQLTAGSHGSSVLDQVQRLAHLQTVVLHPLRCGKQTIEHARDDGDRRRNIRAGEKSRLPSVQLDAMLVIHRCQPIEILMVADAILDRELLDI